jgi:predicted nucleic acid-binding protein
LIVYWDTSALIKLYIREAGTPDVDQLLQGVDVSGTAVICQVEISAALAKLVRMKSLRRKPAQLAWQRFLRDWSTLTHIQLTQPLLTQASTLTWDHGLRGYDAIHLAAAFTWQSLLGETVTFATYDQHLWHTAQNLGMDRFPSVL